MTNKKEEYTTAEQIARLKKKNWDRKLKTDPILKQIQFNLALQKFLKNYDDKR